MNETELKPCPFCGGKPSVFPSDPKKEGDSWTKIVCPRDRCAQVEVLVCSERGHYKAAAKRWNTRAALTPPEGYVLVPVEPTEAMLDAEHATAEIHDEYGENRYVENPEKVWAAMLAARPEVP